MNRRALVAISAVLTFTGCQYDPWADNFLTHQPSEHDVAGFYAVDQGSLQRTIKLPTTGSGIKIDPSAHILLSPDHVAEFFQVPEASNDGLPCTITGRGTWRMGKNDRFMVIWVHITDEESNIKCKNEFSKIGNQLNLYGDKPPYRLHLTIGDPDSGDAIQFEKRN